MPPSSLLPATPAATPKAPHLTVPVTLAPGDGIGPEISAAVVRILEAAQAPLAFETIEVGEKVYLSGQTSGIPDSAWASLRRTRLLLKGPITTPVGGGYKSLNVTMRKALGLFANVRPCVSYAPFVRTRFAGMDVVIIRENEEDTYAGIEHRQTPEVTQCLKLITRPGCERIARYAFAYARANGRKKVTCVVKDNIMKLTDGLFAAVFNAVAREYPDITAERMIVDIGAALLADRPARFDVVLAPNLYGDILSDIGAQVAGSVGLAGSANIGPDFALFEAVHGSAPDIAGQDKANPSGMLQAAVQLLVHVGAGEVAARVQNAWLATLEDGIHTGDIYEAEVSRKLVGTAAFAEAVIARLDRGPKHLPSAAFRAAKPISVELTPAAAPDIALDGVDVFLHWDESARRPAALGERLAPLAGPSFQLQMLTNRGVQVWPKGFPETFCTDHWRARFVAALGAAAPDNATILALLGRVHTAGLKFIKTEHLYRFDGQPGYSLGQGQ
jgi:isocitrate dehydrogenase